MINPYTPAFFEGVAQLSSSNLRRIVENVALQARMDAAEGMMTWLEGLDPTRIVALGPDFWGGHFFLDQSGDGLDLAKRARLASRNITVVPVAPGDILATLTSPRDDPNLDDIPTDHQPMSGAQRSMFERSAHFLQRAQQVLTDANEPDSTCFARFVCHNLGHLRDPAALGWLLAQCPAGLLDTCNERMALNYAGTGRGVDWSGLPSYMALQPNPAGIQALMDLDRNQIQGVGMSWSDRILLSWTTLQSDCGNSASNKVDVVWAEAIVRESVQGRLEDPDSLFATFERMAGRMDPLIQLQAKLSLIGALLHQRRKDEVHGLSALPAVDRLRAGLPAEDSKVFAEQLCTGMAQRWAIEVVGRVASACHAPTLGLLMPAIAGPLRDHHTIRAHSISDQHGIVGRVVDGAMSRTNIQPQDLADCARLLKDAGIDLRCNDLKRASVLHRMAKCGTSDALPKMLALVDLGIDPLAKDGRGWQPSSVFSPELRSQWQHLLRVRSSAAQARDAIAEIAAEAMGLGLPAGSRPGSTSP